MDGRISSGADFKLTHYQNIGFASAEARIHTIATNHQQPGLRLALRLAGMTNSEDNAGQQPPHFSGCRQPPTTPTHEKKEDGNPQVLILSLASYCGNLKLVVDLQPELNLAW